MSGQEVTTANGPRAFTIDETAERLRLNRSTVYEMIKRGELRPVRIGRRWRISERELRRLLGEAGP